MSNFQKQIRVYGIAPADHKSVLKRFLDAEDINCLGVSTPQDERGGFEEVIDTVASMPIDVLVLCASRLDDTLQEWIKGYGKVRSGVATVFVTDTELNVESLQTAMACGINGVVYASDEDAEAVHDTIRKEVSKKQIKNESATSLSHESHVILTYSSKGGAGKTTVAVNLAAALAQRGKKVSIMDLDLASGDVHSFLGINNSESIAELADEPQITPAKIKRYIRPAIDGIGVMCAPAIPQYANAVTPALVAKVITTLRSENDYIIIDCDQQLVNGTIAACNEEAMKAADLLLFIVTPEVPTINGAYEMMHKYMSRFQGIPEKIRLVVNKADSDSTITSAEVAKTLEKPLFMAIPDDYGTVVQTLNIGEPFMSGKSGGKLSSLFRKPIMKAYDQLVDKIIEFFEVG